jgi:hypothetical protein
MGLDTSHDAWHGPYSMFNRWRTWLASQLGIPLCLMEGFYDPEMGSFGNPFSLIEYKFPKGDELELSSIRELKKQLPLKWESFKPSPLHELLYHSDCDGEISYGKCGKIAKALKELLATIKNDNAESRSPETERGCYDGMFKATERFMKGCELAYSKKEVMEFD